MQVGAEFDVHLVRCLGERAQLGDDTFRRGADATDGFLNDCWARSATYVSHLGPSNWSPTVPPITPPRTEVALCGGARCNWRALMRGSSTMTTLVDDQEDRPLADPYGEVGSLRALIEDILARGELSSPLEDDMTEVVDEALQRRGGLGRQLTTQSEAVERALERLRAQAPVYPALVGLALVTFGAAAFLLAMSLRWPWDMARDKHWWPAVVVILVVFYILLGAGIIDVRAARKKARVNFDAAQAAYESRLTTALQGLLRAILNERAGDKAAHGATLWYPEAPALVELEDAEQPVPSLSYQRLAAFVRDHDTSSIGVAGPRGAGKTTIMKALLLEHTIVGTGLYIAAPVSYESGDFVRLLQKQLAEDILRSEELPIGGPPRNPFSRPLLAIRAAAASSKWAWVLIGAIVVIAIDRLSALKTAFDVDPLTLAASLAAVVALVGLVGQARVTIMRIKRPSRASAKAELAYEYLDDLNWSSAYQRTMKTGAKFKSALSAEGTSQVTHSERPRSRPENVANLGRFLRLLYQVTEHRRVVICVDEIDKMAEAEDAVKFVNGLKDLFHIPGTHFVLSVSTDAMYRFAARGIPLRDVFDSSLDTVINVGRFSYAESRSLLDERVLYFPDSAALFCHAWSGGHARDLIRAARAMVTARDLTTGAVPVVDLVPIVLSSDIGETIGAAYDGLSSIALPGEGQSDNPKEMDSASIMHVRQALVDVLDLIQNHTLPLHKSITSSLPALDQAVAAVGARGTSLLQTLPIYLRLCAAVSEMFSIPRGPTEWRGGIESGELIAEAERLAQIRWLLSVRPLQAANLLQQIG